MKPLIQEQQEYLEMAKDPSADLSNALINKFNFTDMAVKETIRVCSGGLAMRKAVQDFVIDNKYVIPKGMDLSGSRSQAVILYWRFSPYLVINCCY